MHAYSSLLLHLFRPAHGVKYLDCCKTSQHQHAQVPGFSVESPVHACNSLLLHLFRPAHCVKHLDCCKSLRYQSCHDLQHPLCGKGSISQFQVVDPSVTHHLVEDCEAIYLQPFLGRPMLTGETR